MTPEQGEKTININPVLTGLINANIELQAIRSLSPDQVALFTQAEELLRQAVETGDPTELEAFLDRAENMFLTEKIDNTQLSYMSIARKRIVRNYPRLE